MKHVQQPTPFTCVHACIAMVTGKPVTEIIEKYGFEKGMSVDQQCAVLTMEGVPFIRYASSFLAWGRVFTVTVPSINIERSTHCVVLDMRDDQNPIIYDPCEGRDGKRFYTYEALKSYTDVVEVFI
jgi:hypothetical protein